MEPAEIIEKIHKAVKLSDILDISNINDEYKLLMKKIHPDVCKLSGANEAATRLNSLKEQHEIGKKYNDESGGFTNNGYNAIYSGNSVLLKKSIGNYNKLMSLKTEADKNFQKYIPKSMEFKDDKLYVNFSHRAISLIDLNLPQIHVNWVLSRILEFCAWLSQNDLTHCSISPESIFIMPENHGIQVANFYLMSNIGDKLPGISGLHQSWYPPEVFVDKKAKPIIDVELAMKTAIYLLGDKSGVGIKLKKDKNINQELLNFAIQQHDGEISEVWKKYRELLSKNFKKEFHVLNI